MKALRDVWADTLIALANDDQRIVVLDGDLANSTKADKFAAAHPDRFLEMGIAEQNMVGVAVGMATLGFVPWLSSFTVFFTHRAVDPIRMLVAQTNANVKIGAAYSGLMTGFTGKTHQDVEDLAIMRAMPQMTVLAPADQSVRCLEAANELAKQQIDVGVLHIPSIKPLNEAALLEVCSAYDLIFTVEEHSVFGGLGGLVAELLSENSPRRVIRYGIEDKWGESAPNDFLLDKYGLSALQVSRRIAKDFKKK
jgi:transketolase